MEKSVNRGYIVRFEHSSGFREQKFMLICKSYRNDDLKYATVCKWVRRFNDGQESVENDPRGG